MRGHLLLGWLVGAVLLVGLVGCDTTQPIRQDQQVAQLSFRALGAKVQEMWTWVIFEDSDQNGAPDDSTGDGAPDEYLWCDPQPAYVDSDMPWSFSVQVDRIPGDSSTAITIARETDANQSFAFYEDAVGSDNNETKTTLIVTNRTGRCTENDAILCNPDNLPTGLPLEPTICEQENSGVCVAVGTCSGDSSVTCEPDLLPDQCQNQGLGSCNDVPVSRRFVFVPAHKQVSGATRTTLAAAINIAYVTDPTAANTRGPTGGRCPGMDLGNPNVDGNAIPWTFTIDRGDTLRVQARRFAVSPDGFAPGAPVPEISPEVVYVDRNADPILSSLTIDGRSVGIQGDQVTDEGDPESFIDFYYLGN